LAATRVIGLTVGAPTAEHQAPARRCGATTLVSRTGGVSEILAAIRTERRPLQAVAQARTERASQAGDDATSVLTARETTVLELASMVVRLLGSPGLTLELFRELLVAEGFVVAEGATEERFQAHVTILVEPQRSHWDEVRDAGVPIVLVVGEASGDQDVV